MSRSAGVIAAIAAAVAVGGSACRSNTEAAPAASAPAAKVAPADASADAAKAAPADAATASAGCEAQPFAFTTSVPEASGAAWLTLDGKPALLIIGDSGNHGAYGILDPDTGATIETGQLPLTDDASDDIEGLSAHAGKIYGLTSAGWVRTWQRSGKGFALVAKAYPLGPVTLPDKHHDQRALEGDGMVCSAKAINCGRNYEGLCLAARPASPACIGFAASKADGHLYCLTEEAGKLVVHHDRAIAVSRPDALADCTFDQDDNLWIGNNVFDLGNVSRVAHWDDPAHARLSQVGRLMVGNPEVIAVRGDLVYRLSDTGGSPSLMAKFRCPRSPR